MSEPPRDWPTVIRVLRIMIIGMLVGIVTIATVFVIVRPPRGNEAAAPPTILTYVLIAAAATTMPFSVIVRRIVSHSSAKNLQARGKRFNLDLDLPPIFLHSTIVALAVLDAGAMMCLVAFLLEGEIAALVTAGMLAAFMTVYWPTAAGVASWQSDKTRQITSYTRVNPQDWPPGNATL